MAEVLDDLRLRDQRDCQRSLSPLRPAEDAVVLDTTPLSLSEVVATLARQVRERRVSTPR